MDDILGKSKLQKELNSLLWEEAREMLGTGLNFSVTRRELERAHGNRTSDIMSITTVEGLEVTIDHDTLLKWHSQTNATGVMVVEDYHASARVLECMGECESGHMNFLGDRAKSFYLGKCTEPGCKSFVRAGAAVTEEPKPKKKKSSKVSKQQTEEVFF